MNDMIPGIQIDLTKHAKSVLRNEKRENVILGELTQSIAFGNSSIDALNTIVSAILDALHAICACIRVDSHYGHQPCDLRLSECSMGFILI